MLYTVVIEPGTKYEISECYSSLDEAQERILELTLQGYYAIIKWIG